MHLPTRADPWHRPAFGPGSSGSNRVSRKARVDSLTLDQSNLEAIGSGVLLQFLPPQNPILGPVSPVVLQPFCHQRAGVCCGLCNPTIWCGARPSGVTAPVQAPAAECRATLCRPSHAPASVPGPSFGSLVVEDGHEKVRTTAVSQAESVDAQQQSRKGL